MPRTPFVPLNAATAQKVRELVFWMAGKYQIAPVLITSHFRSTASDAARLEVWKVMVNDMGFRRWQVAKMFGRDVRRVRASVLAKDPKPAKPIDLWMQPVPADVQQSIGDAEKARLIQFYEREARALRKSLAYEPTRRILTPGRRRDRKSSKKPSPQLSAGVL